ncbi:MAG: hypothetical protein GY765_10635 [bacterium]|nr:hypothetical protein [bacterium]
MSTKKKIFEPGAFYTKKNEGCANPESSDSASEVEPMGAKKKFFEPGAFYTKNDARCTTPESPAFTWKYDGEIDISTEWEKKSYPTPNWQKENGPALTVYNNELYCAWSQVLDTKCIHLDFSANGSDWNSKPSLYTAKTENAPALAVFNEKIYCAWSDRDNKCVSYSCFDGEKWAEPKHIPNSDTRNTPALALWEGRLYCGWAWHNDPENCIKLAYTADGENWHPESHEIKTQALCQPALVTIGNLLLCAWCDEDKAISYVFYSLVMGRSLQHNDNRTIPGVTSQHAPALLSVFSSVFCGAEIVKNNVPFLDTFSTFNCFTWVDDPLLELCPSSVTLTEQVLEKNGVPALQYFKGDLVCAWNNYQRDAISFAKAAIGKNLKTDLMKNETLKVKNFGDFSKADTHGDVGVCLSGGGSRAAIAAMGQLRGLKYIKDRNGDSLLSKVKALSTVSGGSWLGGCYTYLNEADITDDQFLNTYVPDRKKLVLTDKDGNRDIAEVLDQLPNGNFGNPICSEAMYAPQLVASIMNFQSKNEVPMSEIWSTIIGRNILEYFKLYSGGDSGPNSSFAYDENSRKRIVADNPGLEDETFHLYPTDRDARPFWICNMAMISREANHKEQTRFTVPVQATPFFTGVFGTPDGVVDYNGIAIEKGGVSSFAFNSIPESIDSKKNTAEMSQIRQNSLADVIAVSSSFYAYVYLALAGMRKLNVDSAAKAEPGGQKHYDLKELNKMAIDLLNILGLTDPLLKVLGLSSDQIDQLVDGILDPVCDLIQKIFKEEPVLDLISKWGIAVVVLYLFGLVAFQLDEYVADEKEFWAHWNDILVTVDKVCKEALPLVLELVPKYYYWSGNKDQLLCNMHSDDFCDAGILEDSGVGGMLAYRDVRSLICFINSDPIQKKGVECGYPKQYGNSIKTNMKIPGDIPPLFGYGPFDETLPGYTVQIGPNGKEASQTKHNRVFRSSDFLPLLQGLVDVTTSGEDNRKGAKVGGYNINYPNYFQQLTTVENSWFGVKGGVGMKVLWSILNYSQTWVDGLSEEVRESLKPIVDFPNYALPFTQLDKTNINLMSNLTAWSVAADEFRDDILKVFGYIKP